MRANWHVASAATPLDAVDPLASMGTDVGSPVISIESTTEELQFRLRDLLEREARLDSLGITCPLKDQPEASCLACPVCKLGDPDSRMGALCRVGQEQERCLTMIHAQACGV